MPRKGVARTAYRDVRVQRGGQTWTASYHVDAIGRLVLSSAWGSASATATADQRAQAEAMLGEMIDARLRAKP